LDSREVYEENLLLAAVAKGDGTAFNQLVQTHAGFLYNYLFKLCKQKELVEEVLQDIFTQLWITRESLQHVNNFRAYVLTISRNHAIALLKKALREQETISHYWNYHANSQEDAALSEYKFRLIEEAVATLPPRQREVWVLSRREGKKYADIAAELQLSKETVKKHLQFANAAIQQYVQGKLLLMLAMFIGLNS
jgi:RNA polymerase sigma factor, sigma-70 family